MNCTREKEPPRTPAVVLIVQGLREAGHPLDQQMALGQQAHENPLEHVVLARDHPPDLEKRLLEPFLGLGRRGHGQVGALLGHVVSLRRVYRVIYESRRT